MLNQVIKSIAIDIDRSEFLVHLQSLESLVTDAVNSDPLTKRLRGDRWTPTMQHIHDSFIANSKTPVEDVINLPFVPRSGRRKSRAGTSSVDASNSMVDTLHDKLVEKIICIVLNTDLPNAIIARRSNDPELILRGAMGDTRASTMKIYVRAWERLTSWLNMAKSISWPLDVLHVAEYLHNAVTEPCCRSHPQTIIQAVSWFERVAGVPINSMTSREPLFQKTVDYCIGILATGASPAKQAPRLPAICIASLECYICNSEHSTYLRYRAFTICFKIWATLRQDDIQHLSVGNLRLVGNFYAGELLKSKTTGPTKRVKEVPLIVAEDASITGLPWFRCGLSIASEFDLTSLPYMLPACNAGGRNFSHRMAGYSAASAASRLVFSQLKVPVASVIDDAVSWTEGDSSLVPHEIISFWSEHSPRACMPSWTALMGVEKSVRDLLGRWSPTGSEDYTRTYRITVRELQLAVIRAIRADDHRLCEDDIWEKLKRFSDSSAAALAPIPLDDLCAYWKNICMAFSKMISTVGPVSSSNQFCPNVSTEGIDIQTSAPVNVSSNNVEASAEFLIVYSRGRKFARLHSTKTNCHWNKIELTDSIYVTVPLPELYDARCKICWPDQCQEQLDLDSDQYESAESDD